MELVITKRFKKQAQKLVEGNEKIKQKVNACLIDFSQKGRGCFCYRKPLRGNMYGWDELQIGGDIRILARIKDDGSKAVLEQIGTHSQLDL